MQIAILSTFLLVLPAIVAACEGECIIGITNAFISNYTVPVNILFEQLANEVVAKVLTNRRYASPPISLMEPLLSAYRKAAYASLENAIFPSYFHGKCQRRDPENPDGPFVNPPGCPNPNCPVVCGTPGSMVHFYPKLRYIAFNATRHQLVDFASPENEVYQAVERGIVSEIKSGGGRRNTVRAAGTRMPKQWRREQVKRQMREIMGQVSSRLEKICGGMHGLPKCSWEKEMKEFILSYP
ncbi:hypothetical protein D9615_008094 [Tricholomella constricta]|uniref:Uncharacterized protein n=1 Tax=Tricholomella constricta TaxID=117010 RepID=A0A8H5LVY4_9AGAR|nr:hypothetical protein D9615_008094 [Tricholomella constricta]